jgi:hypothetical protein
VCPKTCVARETRGTPPTQEKGREEKTLQRSVIEPLLAALGFTDITDTSGPRARGKDLIATKASLFERPELYAIQIKRFDPIGKSTSARSFGMLLNQLGQMLEEPVLDPTSKVRRAPDKCLFVTP